MAATKRIRPYKQPAGGWGALDPKHTSSFEFCENGGKAVAWESTAERCTPAFFAEHTVSELEGWGTTSSRWRVGSHTRWPTTRQATATCR